MQTHTVDSDVLVFFFFCEVTNNFVSLPFLFLFSPDEAPVCKSAAAKSFGTFWHTPERRDTEEESSVYCSYPSHKDTMDTQWQRCRANGATPMLELWTVWSRAKQL